MHVFFLSIIAYERHLVFINIYSLFKTKHYIGLGLMENSTMLTPSEERTSPAVIDDTNNDGK